MYLTKKTYVKNWDHMKPDEKHSVLVKRGDGEDTGIKPERVSYIEEEVAYWRKANQIHGWFVENCANGEDTNGGYHYVSHEKLKELIDLCKRVIAASELVEGKIANGYKFEQMGENLPPTRVPILQDGTYIKDATVAKELLPNREGFFFGGTEYDQYYIDDLKNTIEMLEPLLEEKGEFYYHSSW